MRPDEVEVELHDREHDLFEIETILDDDALTDAEKIEAISAVVDSDDDGESDDEQDD